MTIQKELEKHITTILEERGLKLTSSAFTEELARSLAAKFINQKRCVVCRGVMLLRKHKYCSEQCSATAIERRRIKKLT